LFDQEEATNIIYQFEISSFTIEAFLCLLRCSHMAEATCLQHEGVFCDEKADCIHRMSSNWFVEEPEDECNTHCHVAGSNWTNAADAQFNCSSSMFHPPPNVHDFTCIAKKVSFLRK